MLNLVLILFLLPFYQMDVESLGKHVDDGSIFRNLDICFGGGHCRNDPPNISLPPNTYITRIEVYCHDNIGKTSYAELSASIDGQNYYYQDVKRNGSQLNWDVNGLASRLSFKVRHKRNHTKTDEVHLHSVTIYTK